MTTTHAVRTRRTVGGNEDDRFCTQADIPGPAAYNSRKDYSSDHGAFLEFKGTFNEAAYKHDLCYGSQIYEKSKCDSDLIGSMTHSCLTTVWILLTPGAEAHCLATVGGTKLALAEVNDYAPRTSANQP